MRHHPSARLPPPAVAAGGSGAGAARRSEWNTLRSLLPYLWQFRWRVALALVFLVAAKAANVSVPIVLKQIVDSLTGEGTAGAAAKAAAEGAARAGEPGTVAGVLAVPLALIVGYGLLRLSTSVFTELRVYVFA